MLVPSPSLPPPAGRKGWRKRRVVSIAATPYSLFTSFSLFLPYLTPPHSLHPPILILSHPHLHPPLPFLPPLPSSSSLPSHPISLFLPFLPPPNPLSHFLCTILFPPSLLPPLLVDVQRRLTSVLSTTPVLSPRAPLPLHHSVPFFFHCNANAVSAGFF